MERVMRQFMHGSETFSPSELEELVEFNGSDVISGSLYESMEVSFCMEAADVNREDDGDWAGI